MCQAARVGAAHGHAHIGLEGVLGVVRSVPEACDDVHAVLMAEVVLNEVVVVAQVNAERVPMEAVDGIVVPFVVELHVGIELVGLPLGTHLPKDVERRLAPVVHPSVPVAVVAVGLVLEAMAYLVGYSLSAT